MLYKGTCLLSMSVLFLPQYQRTRALASCHPGLQAFGMMQALDDNEENVKRTPSPDAFYKKGLRLCKKGQFTQGIKYFSKTIQMDRTHVKAYVNRSLAFERTGQLKKAVNDYTTAIDLRSNINL